MKQNITLSLDKDLIKKAKILAAQRQTSISRMLSEELEKIIVCSMEYDRAKRWALDHLDKGFHFDSKITVSREELHER
jgi:predicted transcriptional regulator